MPHLQFASFSDMVLPYSISATSESPGFPASNVRDIGKPFRSWRSLTANGAVQFLHLEWLVPVNLVGVFVNQVVAQALEIRTEPSIGAAEVSQGVLDPMPQDPRVVRNKYLLLFSGGATPVQAMNLYPTGVVNPADPWFEIGSVVPIAAWRAFPDHFEAPLPWRRLQSITTAAILGGGIQQQKEGRPYVQLVLSNQFFKYIAMSDFLTRLNAPPGEPILLFEDVLTPNLAQAYLMTRITSGDEVSQRITTFQGILTYEELI